MPPKRKPLSKEKLTQLTHDYGIRFEGPVPPKYWPDKHQHLFHNIHKIHKIRYDDYKVDSRILKKQREKFRTRVSHLTRKAYRFLDDVNTNESTWRELESSILERFDKDVICGKCNNELWKPGFEADSLCVEVQSELKAKRLRRKMCCCTNERAISRTENSDDENRPIFEFAKDTSISHALGDDLQNVSVSMRPDRVIGLRAPSRVPKSPSHFPVAGKRILLPFLVVEAKQEVAPGFRAIQCQTAFPVRRLLKAQDDLHDREPSSEPCLVWFFAYQGEQWRLYASTYENERTRIYELWQGTIQSQDGALQLLLIVDFIWSWARDVYRPSVRKVLFDSVTSSCSFSSTSTDRFRLSVSLPSASGPTPTMYDWDPMQVDESVVDTERTGGPYPNVGHGPPEIEDERTAVIKDASSHVSLRWTVGHELAPSWAKFGSIRYSNIVRFEFRCLNVYRVGGLNLPPVDPDDHSVFDILSKMAFLIRPEQLNELKDLWTTNFASIPGLGLNKVVRATIFFQTYCDQSTWEIKRVLNCIVWEDEPFTTVSRTYPHHLPINHGKPEYIKMNDLERTILDIQRICGRDSVWYALRNVSIALLPGRGSESPEWVSFDKAEMPDKAFEFLRGLAEITDLGESVVSCGKLYGALLHIDPGFGRRDHVTIPDIEQDTRNGDAMLAVRSPSSSASCLEFCLFVLLEENQDDKDILCQFLENAITQRDYYGEGDYQFSDSDWQTLSSWRKALEDGLE
ncbi:hypothetical protein K504DRAFT_535194 [Pleomassaria siparia CBS 279.74]|uniref:Uncharacterized protein n=1 Tax=Pleomassaria siparia CBS 279.74 TaxID=1314801 RepID=A0A6G1K3V1_9PLEO|nr:hypothetical protein K504DRAFT_535194 [Pleomassaria siparia CBS 279.74]